MREREPMTPLDCCRTALTDTATAVAATVPSGRATTLLALLQIGEPPIPGDDLPGLAHPGWNLALRLCLERPDDSQRDHPAGAASLAVWAARFLVDCDEVARADEALAQCASGHLQLQQHAPRAFVAWATNRRLSPEQRERTDFDWWSAQIAQEAAPRLATLLAERPRMRALLGEERRSGSEPPFVPGDPAASRYYRDLGQAHIARFAYQHSYPVDASIGGATMGQYTDILALLIGWRYAEDGRRAPGADRAPVPWNEQGLAAALADTLRIDPMTMERALQPLILDSDNAAYHSTLPGRAAPPLIRLDGHRVIASMRGLLGEPLIFLARELRRRHAQEYHNRASLREGVFRQDLARIFSDRRFVLSTGRVELKRRGEARTDLDALVFDRKTGTLGIFELKAQDPFARSVEERQRQRDSFYHANRQVAAILEWVQRRGANDLLARFDAPTAKRFHVQKVYVFVLGRYLAHFTGGPEPDRRAAWGSWPQVLQIVDNAPFASDSHTPLGTLFTRLRDAPPPAAPPDADSHTIAVHDFRLRIYPSFAAMRAVEDHPT